MMWSNLASTLFLPLVLFFYFYHTYLFNNFPLITSAVKTSFCCVAWEFSPTYRLLLWKRSTDIGLSVHVQWLTTRSPLRYQASHSFFLKKISWKILIYNFFHSVGEASKRKVLDWPTRLSVCIGAARGTSFFKKKTQSTSTMGLN